MRPRSSADQAWRLLQSYLDTFDDSGSRHHRAVALTLLSQAFTPPNWFLASYKVSVVSMATACRLGDGGELGVRKQSMVRLVPSSS